MARYFSLASRGVIQAPGSVDADDTHPQRTRDRWPWPLAIGLALLILLPFALAAVGVPAGHLFRGTLKPSGDESQYLAAVRMGMSGAWSWHDPYMTHPPPAILMYPLYMAAGHGAALLGLSTPMAFALLHGLAALLLFGALWRLASPWLDRGSRAWFVAFSLFSGGLYWLVAVLAVFGRAPTSLSAMGAERLSAFTALLMEAHVACGIVGHVMAIAAVLGAARTPRGAAGLIHGGAGCAGVALVGFSIPVLLPLTLLVVGLLTLERLWAARREPDHRGRAARLIALAAFICLPGLGFSAYYYHIFSSGPWAKGGFQSVPDSSWSERLLNWGILLPFAWWGWRRAPAHARPLATALAIWACCAVVGSQLPLWQGDRLTVGISVPLGGLFALGLVGIHVRWFENRRWLLLLGAGAGCHYLFLCTALLSGGSPDLYATAEENRAAAWIATREPDAVVMAPFGFANTLPIVAPARVVAGHGYQTLDLADRLRQLTIVYGPGRSATARARAAKASGATLLVFDQLDTQSGPFFARTLPGAREVYASAHIAVLWLG